MRQYVRPHSGGANVRHGAPATSAPVDHTPRTGWGRTARPPRCCSAPRRPRGASAKASISPNTRRAYSGALRRLDTWPRGPAPRGRHLGRVGAPGERHASGPSLAGESDQVALDRGRLDAVIAASSRTSSSRPRSPPRASAGGSWLRRVGGPGCFTPAVVRPGAHRRVREPAAGTDRRTRHPLPTPSTVPAPLKQVVRSAGRRGRAPGTKSSNPALDRGHPPTRSMPGGRPGDDPPVARDDRGCGPGTATRRPRAGATAAQEVGDMMMMPTNRQPNTRATLDTGARSRTGGPARAVEAIFKDLGGPSARSPGGRARRACRARAADGAGQCDSNSVQTYPARFP